MVRGYILPQVPVCTLSGGTAGSAWAAHRGTQGSVRSQKQGPRTDPGEIKNKKHPFCEAVPHFIGWAQIRECRHSCSLPLPESDRRVSRRNFHPFLQRGLGASERHLADTDPGSEHIFMRAYSVAGFGNPTMNRTLPKLQGQGHHSPISVTLCPDRPGQGGRSWGLHPNPPSRDPLQSPAPSGRPGCAAK